MASRTKVDITCTDVDVIRSSEARCLNLVNAVPLDARFGFFDDRSVGDGQHYRAILIADPPHVFP